MPNMLIKFCDKYLVVRKFQYFVPNSIDFCPILHLQQYLCISIVLKMRELFVISRVPSPNSITTFSTFSKKIHIFAQRGLLDVIFSFRDRRIDALHFCQLFS